MKFSKFTILMMFLSASFALKAQKPVFGQMMSEKVPLYCGSNGTSTADSTRLPVMFQARILGLIPGTSYKYYVRFCKLSDTGNSSTTGAGTSVIVKNGNWKYITSPDMSTANGHDTFSTIVGAGDYRGWFGAIIDGDSRFAPGSYVYPMIAIEQIGGGSPTTVKILLNDSIRVLGYSTTNAADKGTAVWGSSFTKGKSIVTLYDDALGFSNRPIACTYAESDGYSSPNSSYWYSAKVNGVAGAWGAVLPNLNANGVKKIEARDALMDTVIYANVENDATWGNDSTINPHSGHKPVVIKSDYAPLQKPEFEFVSNTTNVVESNTTLNLLVRRKYGNSDSSKVNVAFLTGTATKGVDFDIISPSTMVFRPYGDVIDTVKVKIYDDFISESTENAAIRLSNPINAKIGFQTTNSVIITDNDVPVIRFAKKFIKVAENDGVLKVKLYMDAGSVSSTNVRVVVKSKSDSTLIPQDFKIGNSNRDTTVSFPGAGKAKDSLEFNIWLVNDKRSEDRPDTVVLALRTPTAPGTIGTDSLLTLVITDDDAPSLFTLANSKITVKENVGSIKIKINRVKGNIFQSDVILASDNSGKNAQPGSDYTFNGSQLITFLNSDPDSAVITIPILNDPFSEPTEEAVFYIRNAFNARIGKPDTLRVTILDDDLVEYSIGKVTTYKVNSQILDSLNVHCALRGVVYGSNLGPVGTPNGTTFTLIDNSGGIQVYQSNSTKGYTVNEGDSVQVYGRISQVNGLAQITSLDTIIKLGTGTLLPAQVVATLGEQTENALIKFNTVKLVNPSQWPSTALAPNTSVTLTFLTSPTDSFRMIIDSETDIDGKAAPSTFFNVTGIGLQNDPSNPYTSGYLMAPRRYSDFVNLVSPVFSFRTDTSGAKENHDSSDAFVIQAANLTSPQQITLVIKGGTAVRNVDYQSNTTRSFILSPSAPSVSLKIRMIDDVSPEPYETIVFGLKDNQWGTIIGADSIHTMTITDNETVGINSLLAGKFKLYPNPATSHVNIQADGVLINSVQVLDVNGRAVANVEAIHSESAVLSVEGLSKGVYSIRINSESGVITKILTIQ